MKPPLNSLVPSIIRKAHQQLADAWVAGSMAEREKLITRLWVRGAKSDVERFKMNWHTFKMRLRRVDASCIHTCCELIQRIRDKTAEDNAPRLDAAAKRHKQATDTKMPQEEQHGAKQQKLPRSTSGPRPRWPSAGPCRAPRAWPSRAIWVAACRWPHRSRRGATWLFATESCRQRECQRTCWRPQK